MMAEFYQCESCGTRVFNRQDLYKQRWISLKGGCVYGIRIWLPEERRGVHQHSVGYQDREYHWCSEPCLITIERDNDDSEYFVANTDLERFENGKVGVYELKEVRTLVTSKELK